MTPRRTIAALALLVGAAIDFGVYGVPETYFIGRDGRVAYKQTGPATEEILLQKIQELRQKPVAAATVGTTGGAR